MKSKRSVLTGVVAFALMLASMTVHAGGDAKPTDSGSGTGELSLSSAVSSSGSAGSTGTLTNASSVSSSTGTSPDKGSSTAITSEPTLASPSHASSPTVSMASTSAATPATPAPRLALGFYSGYVTSVDHVDVSSGSCLAALAIEETSSLKATVYGSTEAEGNAMCSDLVRYMNNPDYHINIQGIVMDNTAGSEYMVVKSVYVEAI